jgi:hypothetical protein
MDAAVLSLTRKLHALARLDVRTTAWRTGWRDYLLLMSSVWVGSLGVNFLISGRRRRDYALTRDERRHLLPIFRPWRILALRNGLLRRVGRTSK